MWQHRRVSRVRVASALLLTLSASLAVGMPAQDGRARPWSALRAVVDTLASRFGPVELEPGLAALRPRMARAGLVPSRVYDDTSAWSSRGDAWRALEFTGYRADGAYRLGLRAQAPEPMRAGEYRGRVRLQRVASGRFEWTARDELAVGEARVDDLAQAFDTLLRGLEAGSEASLRAAIARHLPRASARLGALYSLERLVLQREPGGTTAVQIGVRLTPAGVRAASPRYAAFLEKYAAPIRGSLVVADAGGAVWWTLTAADRLWTLRMRLQDGHLVPLDGAATRRLPDRLRVTTDVSTRMGAFGVGAKRLVMDVTLSRTPDAAGMTARFTQEPDWQLPFMVETILDNPLEYPFEAPGSELAWTIRDTPAGGMLERGYRARVRESWILRWLAAMANDAIGDFRAGAEREADHFQRQWLLALRDDLAALE